LTKPILKIDSQALSNAALPQYNQHPDPQVVIERQRCFFRRESGFDVKTMHGEGLML